MINQPDEQVIAVEEESAASWSSRIDSERLLEVIPHRADGSMNRLRSHTYLLPATLFRKKHMGYQKRKKIRGPDVGKRTNEEEKCFKEKVRTVMKNRLLFLNALGTA